VADRGWWAWRAWRAPLFGGLLSGCASLGYYGQAASGHIQLLNARRPLDSVLADPDVAATLRQRLETARELREFASQTLALPDNGSYRSYADLQRSYVVMNVFAAPGLSLQPRRWCFPLVGCVSYRGYFNQEQARYFAARLRERGDDVYLAPVPAYSSLGWFDDPLLNTFIHWSNPPLADLIFHELAHQRLFLTGDTPFNESFATAVGRLGVRAWLARHGTAAEREGYERQLERREQLLALVQSTRAALEQLYASDREVADQRREKARLLADLRDRYQRLKREWGGYAGYDGWFADDLNNAKLGSLHSYTRLVPAFEALFYRSGGDFAAFYRAAEELGRLPPAEREAGLLALLPADARLAGPP
jgi:predicted aminopeptidase